MVCSRWHFVGRTSRAARRSSLCGPSVADQRAVSAVYHAGLRVELTRRLGVAWEPPVNGIQLQLPGVEGEPPAIRAWTRLAMTTWVCSCGGMGERLAICTYRPLV